MRFLLRKTGGRKFQCIDCHSDDPLHSPKVAKLLTGELRPLEWKSVAVVHKIGEERP
jgi:hypothetical protein